MVISNKWFLKEKQIILELAALPKYGELERVQQRCVPSNYSSNLYSSNCSYNSMAFSFNKLMNVYMMWFHAFLREKIFVLISENLFFWTLSKWFINLANSKEIHKVLNFECEIQLLAKRTWINPKPIRYATRERENQ